MTTVGSDISGAALGILIGEAIGELAAAGDDAVIMRPAVAGDGAAIRGVGIQRLEDSVDLAVESVGETVGVAGGDGELMSAVFGNGQVTTQVAGVGHHRVGNAIDGIVLGPGVAILVRTGAEAKTHSHHTGLVNLPEEVGGGVAAGHIVLIHIEDQVPVLIRRVGVVTVKDVQLVAIEAVDAGVAAEDSILQGSLEAHGQGAVETADVTVVDKSPTGGGVDGHHSDIVNGPAVTVVVATFAVQTEAELEGGLLDSVGRQRGGGGDGSRARDLHIDTGHVDFIGDPGGVLPVVDEGLVVVTAIVLLPGDIGHGNTGGDGHAGQREVGVDRLAADTHLGEAEAHEAVVLGDTVADTHVAVQDFHRHVLKHTGEVLQEAVRVARGGTVGNAGPAEGGRGVGVGGGSGHGLTVKHITRANNVDNHVLGGSGVKLGGIEIEESQFHIIGLGEDGSLVVDGLLLVGHFQFLDGRHRIA